jgi:hypothetical protein
LADDRAVEFEGLLNLSRTTNLVQVADVTPTVWQTYPFTVTLGRFGWSISVCWPHGTDSIITFDGSNYFHLARQRDDPSNSAGYVTGRYSWTHLAPAYKVLWFAFGLSLPTGHPSYLPPPFLGIPHGHESAYRSEIVRSPVAPQIPLSAIFVIDRERLDLVLEELGARIGRLGWTYREEKHRLRSELALLRSTLATDQSAVYQATAFHDTAGFRVPIEFRLDEPYMAAPGMLTWRQYHGEVTNVVYPASTPQPPELNTNSWIQDVRSGNTYQYQATAGRWLSEEEVVATGQLVFGAQPLTRIQRIGTIIDLRMVAATAVVCTLLLPPLVAWLWLLRRYNRKRPDTGRDSVEQASSDVRNS